jgi:hypothetical protein
MKTLLAAAAALALSAPASAATAHHHRHPAYDYGDPEQLDRALANDAGLRQTSQPIDQASAEGYHRASGFDQVKAQCEAYADGESPAYISPGSSTYADNLSELGKTIGSWTGHSRAYNQCMAAHGYIHN